MTDDDAARQTKIAKESWKRAMATRPPTTPASEDFETWDRAQISSYYAAGGSEP